MPTLESVTQEFQGTNLEVVGVSVDQGNSGLVRKYLKETGITFPNFHDHKSEVSRVYQATAIPSVYLISPDGFLAGIVRGGKSWETQEVLDSLKKLIKHKTLASLNGGSVVREKGKGFSFPKELLPPIMKVKLIKTESGVLKLRVLSFESRRHSPGDSRRYLIKVPKVKFPKGIESKGVTSTTGLREGESILEYHYPFVVKEEGKYQIGPIELSYQPRIGGAERFSRHPGTPLSVMTWWQAFGWKEISLSVGLLFLLGLSLFWWLKKRQKKESN